MAKKKKNKGNYNYAAAIKAGLKPGPDGHWDSVDPTTGYFLKSKQHPSLHEEINWFKSQGKDSTFGPHTHKIVTDPTGYFGEDQLRYIPIGNFIGPSEYSHGGPAPHPEESNNPGWLNWLQTGLDVAGLVPGYGEIFDGINAAIYAGRGDKTNAALSLGAMVPLAGASATLGKLGKKAKEFIPTGFIDNMSSFKLPENVVVRHGSNNPDLKLDDINFTDPFNAPNKLGSSRPRKGKRIRKQVGQGKLDPAYSPAGFYTSPFKESFGKLNIPEGTTLFQPKSFDAASKYNITIPGGTKVLNYPRTTSAISSGDLKHILDQGYGAILGKDLTGSPEFLPLAKRYIKDFKKVQKYGGQVRSYQDGGPTDPPIYNADLLNVSNLLPEVTVTDQLPNNVQAYMENLRRTNPIAYRATSAQNKAGQSITDIANWLPGSGEAIDAGYTADALSKGNYGDAALYGAGLALPFVPGKFFKNIAKELKRTVKNKATKKLKSRDRDKALTEYFGEENVTNIGTDNIRYSKASPLTGTELKTNQIIDDAGNVQLGHHLLDSKKTDQVKDFVNTLGSGADAINAKILKEQQILNHPIQFEKLVQQEMGRLRLNPEFKLQANLQNSDSFFRNIAEKNARTQVDAMSNIQLYNDAANVYPKQHFYGPTLSKNSPLFNKADKLSDNAFYNAPPFTKAEAGIDEMRNFTGNTNKYPFQPGSIGLGYPYMHNIEDINRVTSHELGHLFDKPVHPFKGSLTESVNLGKQYKRLPLQTELGNIRLKPDSELTKNLKKQKNYFQTGSDFGERIPYARELRETLVDRGHMKLITDSKGSYYQDVTGEQLFKAFNDLKTNPVSTIIRGGAKGPKVMDHQRLFNIMVPDMENFKSLATKMNKLPAIVPGMLGAKIAKDYIQNESPEGALKYGGKVMKKINKYAIGGFSYQPDEMSGDTVGILGKTADQLGLKPQSQLKHERKNKMLKILPGLAGLAIGGLPGAKIGMGVGGMLSGAHNQDLNAGTFLQSGMAMASGLQGLDSESLLGKLIYGFNNQEEGGLPDSSTGPYYSHAMGGRIEAEGGEFYVSDDGIDPVSLGRGNLKEMSDGMFKIGGPSHANDGVDMGVGEGYIHSKRFLSDADLGKKYNAKSNAQVAENIAKLKKKLEAFGNAKEDVNTKALKMAEYDKDLIALEDSGEQYKQMKGIDSAGNKIAAYGGRYMPYNQGGDTPMDFSKYLPEGGIPKSVQLAKYIPALTNLFAPTPDPIRVDRPVNKMEKMDFNPLLDRYLKSIGDSESNLIREIGQSGVTGGRGLASKIAVGAKSDKQRGKAYENISQLALRDKSMMDRLGFGYDKLDSQLGLQELKLNLGQEAATAAQKAKGLQQFGTNLQTDFWDPIKFSATGTTNFDQMGLQKQVYEYLNQLNSTPKVRAMGGPTSYIDSYYTNILNER